MFVHAQQCQVVSLTLPTPRSLIALTAALLGSVCAPHMSASVKVIPSHPCSTHRLCLASFHPLYSGFWANWTQNVSSQPLTTASRCPSGYCGCSQSACPLPAPLSYQSSPDPLCTPPPHMHALLTHMHSSQHVARRPSSPATSLFSHVSGTGYRTGILCGGCLPGYTQSLDGYTCISNEVCSQNVWWVWTLSVFWYAFLSLCIVVSCSTTNQSSSGTFSALLFYFQMSSFCASLDNNSAAISWAVSIAQFDSIFALTSHACWWTNMGAVGVEAAKLIGQTLVLVFSLVWTFVLQKFDSRLQRFSIQLRASYQASFGVAVLYVFSNVASVIFILVNCTSDGVLFIDGNVNCYDSTWRVLIGFVVIICIFPIAFALALRYNKLPKDVRDAVCRAYTEKMFSWGSITLSFRLIMSITTLIVPIQYPNLDAFVHLMSSILMFFFLVHLRPYVIPTSFWVDVVCYMCLILQVTFHTPVHVPHRSPSSLCISV